MNKREIRIAIQGWYDTANWYGSVNTPLGTLTDIGVLMLAAKMNIKLTFNTAS